MCSQSAVLLRLHSTSINADPACLHVITDLPRGDVHKSHSASHTHDQHAPLYSIDAAVMTKCIVHTHVSRAPMPMPHRCTPHMCTIMCPARRYRPCAHICVQRAATAHVQPPTPDSHCCMMGSSVGGTIKCTPHMQTHSHGVTPSRACTHTAGTHVPYSPHLPKLDIIPRSSDTDIHIRQAHPQHTHAHTQYAHTHTLAHTHTHAHTQYARAHTRTRAPYTHTCTPQMHTHNTTPDTHTHTHNLCPSQTLRYQLLPRCPYQLTTPHKVLVHVVTISTRTHHA